MIRLLVSKLSSNQLITCPLLLSRVDYRTVMPDKRTRTRRPYEKYAERRGEQLCPGTDRSIDISYFRGSRHRICRNIIITTTERNFDLLVGMDGLPCAAGAATVEASNVRGRLSGAYVHLSYRNLRNGLH